MARILVIDDELGPRESLRMVLKNDYDVALADHVDEGLAKLQEWQPDVVIMDIRMPNKSGIEGLQELRVLDPLVSVIMLTGYGSLETAQKAIRLGANDYLKKPFDIEEIRKTVAENAQRTALQRRRGKALDELKQLNNNLREQVMMKEQLAAVGEASAEFAHDLRNPLTMVVGYCGLLFDQLERLQEKGTEYQETIEYLKVIEDNVQRCHDLANMWQKSGNEGTSRMEPVAVDELMTELVGHVQPLMSLDHDQVEYRLDVQSVHAKGERIQLMRILNNLVTNSLHALGARQGVIDLRCRAEGDQVVIEVEDNGEGIPASIMDRVFEQHFTTKTPDKGTGLGLAITRKIVEDHGGSIDIQSEEGKGTLVRILLPALNE